MTGNSSFYGRFDQYFEMEDVVSQQAAEACHYLHSQIPIELQRPAVGIICGSGLHGLADVVISQPRHALHYRDIPHFPLSTGNLDSSSAGKSQR